MANATLRYQEFRSMANATLRYQEFRRKKEKNFPNQGAFFQSFSFISFISKKIQKHVQQYHPSSKETLFRI